VQPTPEQLGDLPLFESLSPNELRAVASLTELRDADAGDVLLGEGAAGYAMFVIVSGSATVTSGGDEVTTLGPGDFFGEIALVGEGRRTATVTAESPVTLVVMHGSDFRVFERDFPEMSQQLKRVTAERLERAGG
jgi:CRP/FNR family transcriptional regulator, cyclic AMP receptor protein